MRKMKYPQALAYSFSPPSLCVCKRRKRFVRVAITPGKDVEENVTRDNFKPKPNLIHTGRLNDTDRFGHSI